MPWREIIWALRRLEARGLIRGGHFVTGVTGEQFAEESTIPLLRGRRGRVSDRQSPARAEAGWDAVARTTQADRHQGS